MAFRDVIEFSVDIGSVKFYVCKGVYKPSDDTWLAMELIDVAAEYCRGKVSVVDVGCGTGVLGFYAAERLESTKRLILIDINPYACRCCLDGLELNGLGHVGEVVCCDNITCLSSHVLENTLVIYNTPYLPVRDEGVEALAWSGGIGEAHRIVAAVTGKACCIILVYSSLSGIDKSLLSLLSIWGYDVRVRRVHIFFEDIVGVLACRKNMG